MRENELVMLAAFAVLAQTVDAFSLAPISTGSVVRRGPGVAKTSQSLMIVSPSQVDTRTPVSDRRAMMSRLFSTGPSDGEKPSVEGEKAEEEDRAKEEEQGETEDEEDDEEEEGEGEGDGVVESKRQAKKRKRLEKQLALMPSSASKPKVKLEAEVTFFEGGPDPSELAAPAVSILTVIGVIPFTAALARQAWVKYTLTSRRIKVVSGWGGRDTTEIVYPDIVNMVYVWRFFGRCGDMVLTLRDGSKLEIRSLPDFERNYKYIFDRTSERRQSTAWGTYSTAAAGAEPTFSTCYPAQAHAVRTKHPCNRQAVSALDKTSRSFQPSAR